MISGISKTTQSSHSEGVTHSARPTPSFDGRSLLADGGSKSCLTSFLSILATPFVALYNLIASCFSKVEAPAPAPRPADPQQVKILGRTFTLPAGIELLGNDGPICVTKERIQIGTLELLVGSYGLKDDEETITIGRHECKKSVSRFVDDGTVVAIEYTVGYLDATTQPLLFRMRPENRAHTPRCVNFVEETIKTLV